MYCLVVSVQTEKSLRSLVQMRWATDVSPLPQKRGITLRTHPNLVRNYVPFFGVDMDISSFARATQKTFACGLFSRKKCHYYGREENGVST